MRRVLARWQRSGLSLQEFGQQRGIPLSTLTWWRHVFRRAGEPVTTASKSGSTSDAVVFTEVFVTRGATDLRRSFDRVSAQVQEILHQDPLSATGQQRVIEDVAGLGRRVRCLRRSNPHRNLYVSWCWRMVRKNGVGDTRCTSQTLPATPPWPKILYEAHKAPVKRFLRKLVGTARGGARRPADLGPDRLTP
jgi:hypothetical protein